MRSISQEASRVGAAVTLVALLMGQSLPACAQRSGEMTNQAVLLGCSMFIAEEARLTAIDFRNSLKTGFIQGTSSAEVKREARAHLRLAAILTRSLPADLSEKTKADAAETYRVMSANPTGDAAHLCSDLRYPAGRRLEESLSPQQMKDFDKSIEEKLERLLAGSPAQ